MSQAVTSPTTITVGDDQVRPFQVNVPQADIDDLKQRIARTRWPERETVPGDTQGVQLSTIQALAAHWATHDWRDVESRLNSYPQFLTTIDGLDIHFIHVRSKHEGALPLIVTHGWPGSIIEQLKIIGPLTDPTAWYGGSASDAFDVVIPSLPGYGFSGKPTAPGWNPVTIAAAWTTLMKRLGYARFVAQGGDWGNAVSEIMALQAPRELLAISTNMAATVPAEISAALAKGEPPPDTLTADERRAWDQLAFFYGKGLGYANEMGLRPQTLYAIEDSPIGLAAWMLDHDAASYRLIARVFNGEQAGLTRDDIVENVSLYWFTRTAVSSGRLYWDTQQLPPGGGFFDARGVQIPVAVSAFHDEIYTAPESWAQRAYPKLISYRAHPVGCHFAAWEQPQALTEDLREAFRQFRD
jgi:pimeloyl-ACP methyl ester carboxylesterase